MLPDRQLNFRRRLRFLLFVPHCPLCGAVVPMRRLFCPACERTLFAQVRRRSLQPQGWAAPLRAVAVMPYTDRAKQMIERYKFQGKIDARDALGTAVGVLARETFGAVDAAVPVPSRPGRSRELGFDHAGELAAQAARVLGCAYLPVLRRSAQARVQHTLGRAERLENLKGAVDTQADLTDRRLLLVDDILTTGATLCECAQALRRAGAREVVCACVCSVSPQSDERQKPAPAG